MGHSCAPALQEQRDVNQAPHTGTPRLLGPPPGQTMGAAGDRGAEKLPLGLAPHNARRDGMDTLQRAPVPAATYAPPPDEAPWFTASQTLCL